MKILHLDKNHPLMLDQLAAAGCINHENYTDTKREIEEIIADYDGIVIRSRFTIDATFIDRASRLKFIARVGAGLESIDTEYAQGKNITLISSPEGNAHAVGEHALGMLLSLFNNLPRADREIRQGLWNRESNRGVELTGKTVGIIGYGNMGKSFARKLQGFDTRVLCYDILPQVGDEYAQQVSLEELQEQADVLSLHIPLTPLTTGLVNGSFINGFKKPFYLINTARGRAVVTADLVEALQQKKILGAALDVLEYEKRSFEGLMVSQPPEALQALLTMDNVLFSPHIAGWTVESKIQLAQVVVDKILALKNSLSKNF